MAQKRVKTVSQRRDYYFVFAITAECCADPHLWAQAARGRTTAEAMRAAKRVIQRSGATVHEVVEVKGFTEKGVYAYDH